MYMSNHVKLKALNPCLAYDNTAWYHSTSVRDPVWLDVSTSTKDVPTYQTCGRLRRSELSSEPPRSPVYGRTPAGRVTPYSWKSNASYLRLQRIAPFLYKLRAWVVSFLMNVRIPIVSWFHRVRLNACAILFIHFPLP